MSRNRSTTNDPRGGRSAGGATSLINDLHLGPAGLPCKRHDGEGRLASHAHIAFKIGREPALSAIYKNAGVAGSKERSLIGQHKSAAGFSHIDAVLIEVRAGNFAAASNTDVVGAVHSAAARAPIDEEVVIAVVFVKARRLDRLIVRQRCDGRAGGQQPAGFRIELDEFDSAPIRTECQPEGSIVIGKYRGIDGVEVAALPRLNDDAVVGPAIRGIVRIESGGGGEAD